jgi:hypothetical protein
MVDKVSTPAMDSADEQQTVPQPLPFVMGPEYYSNLATVDPGSRPSLMPPVPLDPDLQQNSEDWQQVLTTPTQPSNVCV